MSPTPKKRNAASDQLNLQREFPIVPSLASMQPPEDVLRDSSGAALSELPHVRVVEPQSSGVRLPRSKAALQAEARLQARVKAAAEASQARSDNLVLQTLLPLWSDMRRAVPNPFLRSGLFGIGGNKARKFLNGEQVISAPNFTIRYKGEELQQDDLSVWMSLLNLARAQRAADAVYFSGYQLIRDLGWRMHSDSYKRWHECISRLKVNGIEVVPESKRHAGYVGSLIRDFGYADSEISGGEAADASRSDQQYVDEEAECAGTLGRVKWMVRFEPRIANLFMHDDVTLLWWEQRKAIGLKSSLTLWLHGFYSSHSTPIPLSIDYLRGLSRSESSRAYDFRVRLRSGLDTLVSVGCLESYYIVGDMVHVRKAGFPTQQELAMATKPSVRRLPKVSAEEAKRAGATKPR